MRKWILSLLLLLSIAGGIGVLPARAAQAEHHAALIVDLGDGRVLVRVVAFPEETISGEELLLRSGLNVGLTTGLGAGAAVCAIEDVGCPATPQDCWCQCRGADCQYWSYFILQEDGWVYAGQGTSNRRLGDGDVDGWVWGDGNAPPPLLTWEQIWTQAQPAQATATASPPSPPPTATPPPAPTATPVPPSPTSTSPQTTATSAATTAPAPTKDGTAVAATAPSSPTPRPSPPPTETVAPSLPPPTATPPPVPSPADTPETRATPEADKAPVNALAYAGMVLALLVLGLWVWRRRREG